MTRKLHLDPVCHIQSLSLKRIVSQEAPQAVGPGKSALLCFKHLLIQLNPMARHEATLN